MRVNRTVSLFIVVISLFTLCFSGCGTEIKNESIPQCDIPMQSVTQSSKGDLVTFEYLLPTKWESIPKQYFSTLSFDPLIYDNITAEVDEEVLPYALIIDNYEHPGASMDFVTDEAKQIYKDLFMGKTDGYKKKLEDDIKYINEFIFYKHNYEQDNDIVTDQNFIPQDQYIIEYSVQYYNGANGTIAAVKYTYDYNGKTYRAIDCIRDDVTYVVRGGFDDTLLISSGDIALWVADSLKITESFSIQNGSIEKIS